MKKVLFSIFLILCVAGLAQQIVPERMIDPVLLRKTGGTMTGDLSFGNNVDIIFEGVGDAGIFSYVDGTPRYFDLDRALQISGGINCTSISFPAGAGKTPTLYSSGGDLYLSPLNSDVYIGNGIHFWDAVQESYYPLYVNTGESGRLQYDNGFHAIDSLFDVSTRSKFTLLQASPNVQSDIENDAFGLVFSTTGGGGISFNKSNAYADTTGVRFFDGGTNQNLRITKLGELVFGTAEDATLERKMANALEVENDFYAKGILGASGQLHVTGAAKLISDATVRGVLAVGGNAANAYIRGKGTGTGFYIQNDSGNIVTIADGLLISYPSSAGNGLTIYNEDGADTSMILNSDTNSSFIDAQGSPDGILNLGTKTYTGSVVMSRIGQLTDIKGDVRIRGDLHLGEASIVISPTSDWILFGSGGRVGGDGTNLKLQSTSGSTKILAASSEVFSASGSGIASRVNLAVNGTVTASTYYGDGSQLTGILTSYFQNIMEASGDLDSGDLVYVTSQGKVEKISVSDISTLPAVAAVIASASTGENATVIFEGIYTWPRYSALAAGAILYAGTNAAFTESPASNVQTAGVCLGGGKIAFRPSLTFVTE